MTGFVLSGLHVDTLINQERNEDERDKHFVGKIHSSKRNMYHYNLSLYYETSFS